MTKTTLYITRHGQTMWNEEHRMQGHGDSPLTNLGIQQAIWLSNALKDVHFDAIYSSTSLRTKRTAELIRDKRDLFIHTSDELREIAIGTWEGRTSFEIEQDNQEERRAFWHAPHLYKADNGGETFPALYQRVVPYIQRLIAEYEGQTLLLVTHSVTLKVLMGYFEQRPLEDLWNSPSIHPTSLSKVVVEDGISTIELYADITHYKTTPIPGMLERREAGATHGL